MKINNLDQVLSNIRPHLHEYLSEHGRDTSKLFKCINPSHQDRSPSCGTGGANENLFHCFGCGSGGDIFKAAHYLENKPLVGKEFIIETVLPLAEKYGVEVQGGELTEEEIYEMDTYRVYRFASEYISSCTRTSTFNSAREGRGWNKEICAEYGVGCVPSFKDFREHLKNLGFSATFLDDVDLGRKELFDTYCLIFTIKDEHGRPVGFASRNLNYTEDKTNGAKYVNQRTTGAKCNIYRKGTRLFGFDRVVKSHSKKSDPVYVFEGYGDVVTAAQHGLTNCVALGGTSFSVDQLELLKGHGFYNVVLCLDGDEAGQKRTADLLDTTLGGHKDVRLGIVIMPDALDPDDFIREKDIDAFSKLRVWNAFEWRLLKFDEATDPEVICKAMVPLIVNEPSSITQEKLVKTLSAHTGVSQKAIFSDVNKLLNTREAEKQRARQTILEKMTRQVSRVPSEAEVFIHEANGQLQELNKRFDEDSFSEDSCLAFLDSQKELEESKTGEYQGFVLGDDLKALQEALMGEWKKDVWLAFGGKANAGKTSLLCKIAKEIAGHEENNAVVIYHSIDDSKEQIIPKFICAADASRQLTINQVRDPKFYAKRNKKFQARRDKGYDAVRKLMKDGRLILKDSDDGISLAYADTLIGYYKNRFPDRNVVYILDNFHKLQDYQNADERVRFKALSTQIKALATKHHVAILSTVEYTKLLKGQKPSNNNIGETGQIEYDTNFICHMYSDLHEMGEGAATHYHVASATDAEEPKKMPRIECVVGKNKISSFKGSVWLDFHPDNSDFDYVNPSVPQEDQRQAKAEKKTRESGGLEFEG